MTVLAYGPDPTDVIGRRVMAWIADSFISYGVLIVFGALFGIWDDLGETAYVSMAAVGDPTALIVLVVFTILWALVRMVLVAEYGWTPGKLIFGLRVVVWDGRPPGYGKALVRAVVFGLGESLLGCIYWLGALAFAFSSRGHRQPADFAANTYVIDAVYLGRLIMPADGRVAAGPESVTAEELAAFRSGEGATVVPPPGKKSTEPFFDKGRDTYVVFNTKQDRWLQFDKVDGTWGPLQ